MWQPALRPHRPPKFKVRSLPSYDIKLLKLLDPLWRKEALTTPCMSNFLMEALNEPIERFFLFLFSFFGWFWLSFIIMKKTQVKQIYLLFDYSGKNFKRKIKITLILIFNKYIFYFILYIYKRIYKYHKTHAYDWDHHLHTFTPSFLRFNGNQMKMISTSQMNITTLE